MLTNGYQTSWMWTALTSKSRRNAGSAVAVKPDMTHEWAPRQVTRPTGRPVIERVLRGRLDRLEAAERQFEKRGGILILVGRFIPGGRTLSSMSAGALGFSWPRFIAWDILAAVIWSIQAALPGYIGGVVVADQPWLAMLVGFSLSLLFAGGIAIGQQWWRRRHAVDVGDAATDGSVSAAE